MGFFQARVLEWVAISFSKESSQPRDRIQVSHIVGRRLPSEPPGKLQLLSLLSSPYGIPIMQMLVCLMLFQRSVRVSLFLFILFSLFTAMISTFLSFSSLICFSVSVILLLIPSSVLFISDIALLISFCLSFSSSWSLLDISYIILICAFILFPRS